MALLRSKDGACKTSKHTEVLVTEKIVSKAIEKQVFSKLNQLAPQDKDDDVYSRNVELKMGEIWRKELGLQTGIHGNTEMKMLTQSLGKSFSVEEIIETRDTYTF